MHKEIDISIEGLSKIEGSASLDIKVRKGKVIHAKLKVSENKRFYTQAIRGKTYNTVHQSVSRICGTCSIAHQMCCIKAIENALRIENSEQTIILRNLAMQGLMIRDHSMHLYLFCLPDIYGKDSVLEFDGKLHQLVHDAFDVKGVGNDLCKLVAGRAVHPIYPQIGYFSEVPNRAETKKVIEGLKKIRPKVLDLIEIFYNSTFSFETETNFVALVSEDYNYLNGEIRSSSGICIPEINYWDHLNRVVIPYSQATAFEFEGKEYMVGALSRMNLNKDGLEKETKKDVKQFLKVFPSNNVYHNNLAQAIEILNAIDYSIKTLETVEFKKEKKPEIKPKESDGIGVIEAPRGTLYYMISLDRDGKVRYGNLVIPTAQNQIKMENDIRALVSRMLDRKKEEIVREIEKLIRAYDPCMSCASHFLKVRWI